MLIIGLRSTGVTYSHDNGNIVVEFSEALQGYDGTTTVDVDLYVENLGFTRKGNR